MTDPLDSDHELRIDESPENDSDILCIGEYNIPDIKKSTNKICNKSDNSEKHDKSSKTLENKNGDNNLEDNIKNNNEDTVKDELIFFKNNEFTDITKKDDEKFPICFEKKAASYSPKSNEDINSIIKKDFKKKDPIKDIKDLHKEIILKPSAEGLLKVPENRNSTDETSIATNNQYINRTSRASSVCSSSSMQRNKRKSNTPKHVNFISERINSAFEENELQKQKILDILQGAASVEPEYKYKAEKRKTDDEDNVVEEKKIREDKNIQLNNTIEKEKSPIAKVLINAESTLGKLLVEKEKDKPEDKLKEVLLKNSTNIASPKDANFAPIKPKPPPMIFKPMKNQTSTFLSSQSTSLSGTKSPTKNSIPPLPNSKDNSPLIGSGKQLNAIAQLSKNITKVNGQPPVKSAQDNDVPQTTLTTPSLSIAPQSKKRTQYHKMMNRSQGEPTVREMLSPQIKYSRNKTEQQTQNIVSRSNGVMTQNASFINYQNNIYPQQMLVASTGYPSFSGQPIYSNAPYSYFVPASSSLSTQIINDSSTPPKLALVGENTNNEVNGNKVETDEFKEMPDIQHTKTQAKDDNASAKENSKPSKIKKLVDEKDIEEVSRAFEKEAEKCSGLRGGRKRKVLKHSLDGGTMIEEHPEPPKHILKKSLEKIVPKNLIENARNSRDKKKLNVPTPEKRKGSSKEIQRLLDMDFGVGKSPFEETNYDKYTQSILKLSREREEASSCESFDTSKKKNCLKCNGPLPTPRTRKSDVKFCSKDCEKQYNSKSSSRRSLKDNVSISSNDGPKSEPSSSPAKEVVPEVKGNEIAKKGRGGRKTKGIVKNDEPTIVETPKTSKKPPTPKQSPNVPAPNLVPEVTPDQSIFKSPSSKSVTEEDKTPMPVLESVKSPSSSPQVTPKEVVANSIFTIDGLDVNKVKSWTPNEVMLWVNALCKNDLGQIFKDEEIDGECLLILDKETLKQHLQFKVGPSMKILEEIKKLKELQKLS
uniref:SAM domain-containing protein n=1 Tax=Strongyloides venezuelensis TaxID=75913 RepID=A0A0K0FZV8_STRVS